MAWSALFDHTHIVKGVPVDAEIELRCSKCGTRFPNAKALVAYAGLDATVRASGQFEGTRNRISKRGSPTLRNSLWLAAVTARRFNPELKAYYDAKRSQGKHSGVATGAVARRLVHLIYSIWKDNRPFEPDYKWTPPGGND